MKKAWRKLYNRESFSGRTAEMIADQRFRPPQTKAVSGRKVSPAVTHGLGIRQIKVFVHLFKWVAHKGGAFMPEFGAYAPNITGCGAEPRRTAFLLELLNNACVVRCALLAQRKAAKALIRSCS